MQSDWRPFLGQFRPDAGVNPRGDQVERHYRQLRKDGFDECFAALPIIGVQCPMDAMEKLRSRDGRQSDRFPTLDPENPGQIQLPAISSNEYAGVDQRSHGDSGKGGWFLTNSSSVSQ